MTFVCNSRSICIFWYSLHLSHQPSSRSLLPCTSIHPLCTFIHPLVSVIIVHHPEPHLMSTSHFRPHLLIHFSNRTTLTKPLILTPAEVLVMPHRLLRIFCRLFLLLIIHLRIPYCIFTRSSVLTGPNPFIPFTDSYLYSWLILPALFIPSLLHLLATDMKHFWISSIDLRNNRNRVVRPLWQSFICV